MRLRLFSVAALCALACAAFAEPLVFIADLSGAAEEPPNASPGTGSARVTIDAVAHTMRVEASFQDLMGTVTVSHIHVINGPGDANIFDTIGPVATQVPTFDGFPAGVTSGAYDQTFDMTLSGSYNPTFVTNSGGTVALAEAALFSAIMDGRAYLNIHSTSFAGGEIRGFLAPVPEPGTMAALALGGLALLRKRRKD
jgi:hypothetical protein